MWELVNRKPWDRSRTQAANEARLASSSPSELRQLRPLFASGASAILAAMSQSTAGSPDGYAESSPLETAHGKDQIYVFVAGGRRLGLPALAIDRLVRAVEIVWVPGGGPCNPGGIHVAGEYVPILDVSHLFGMAPLAGQPDLDHHFVLLRHNGTQVALWAQEVCGLIAGGHLHNVPHSSGDSSGQYWQTLQTLAGPVLVCEPEALITACLRGQKIPLQSEHMGAS